MNLSKTKMGKLLFLGRAGKSYFEKFLGVVLKRCNFKVIGEVLVMEQLNYLIGFAQGQK